jgi:putative acetyltransferase
VDDSTRQARPVTNGAFVVRSARVSELAEIARTHLDAFAHDERPAALVEAVVASDRYLPELSLVAVVEDDVIGHVLFSHVDLLGADGVSHEVLALSPLGVRVAHQRCGVGSALVTAGLVIAQQRGERVVTVEGHPSYYPRFGFQLASSLGIEMRLPSWAPREAAMAMRFGGDGVELRGRIEYPPSFDIVAED